MIEKMEFEDFKELVDRVQTDDPSEKDIQLLREQMPLFRNFTKLNANLATQAGERLLEGMNSPPVVTEFYRLGWRDFTIQLGVEHSPPLEQALIHQAALCWLRLNIVEQQYTGILYESTVTLEKARYWESRLNAAQRRFLRAMETLARVRKLKLPPMQVNIAAPGSQQANVMGDVKVGKK